MKLKHLLLLLMTVVSFSATRAADEWKNVKFNPDVRYSQWVLDSRLGDFYGNTKRMGFATFNQDLSAKTEFPTWTKEGKTQTVTMDYVAGLVAKAAVEAAILYQDYDWSKPWFKSVMSYANYKDNKGNGINITNAGGSLDDLNAAKMFFGLKTLAEGKFKSIAESTTASNADTQLGNALEGLEKHNKPYNLVDNKNTGGYAFPSNTTVSRDGISYDVSGGWFHKSNYINQMWLDGQYMGPALLAQLIKNGYSPITGTIDGDWDLIAKQFTIVWEQCWDDKEKLLYHAFSSVANSTWADDAEIWTTRGTDTSNWTGLSAGGHSAAFWGRAEGWYFLALVDVLEQMPTNNKNHATLKGYLDELAAGIAARQDKTTGCWYQLLAKDGNYSAQYYNGNGDTTVSNYLESSCTAIFTAAYLKGAHLKLFGGKNAEYIAIAKNAYEGLVNQFMKQKEDGTVELVGCSRSAGLGTTAVGTDKFRDGSNAYYLKGYDVTPTPTPSSSPNTVTDGKYTEGKVLGAFILAATEYEQLYQTDKLLFEKDLAPTYTLKSDKPSITLNAYGVDGVTYQWYKDGGGAVTDATSATFTPTESGKYYCTATANGKTITSSTTDVTVTAETGDGTFSTATISWRDMCTGENTPEKAGVSTAASVTANNGVINGLSLHEKTLTVNSIVYKRYSGFAGEENKAKYFEYSYNDNDGIFTPTKISVTWVPNGSGNIKLNVYAVGSDNEKEPVLLGTLSHTKETLATDDIKEISNSDFKKIRIVPYGKDGGSVVLNGVEITGTVENPPLTFDKGTLTDRTLTVIHEPADAGQSCTIGIIPTDGVTCTLGELPAGVTASLSADGKTLTYNAPAAGTGFISIPLIATTADHNSYEYTVLVGTRVAPSYTSQYDNNKAWTPAVGGTIALSKLINYEGDDVHVVTISSGDAATLSADGKTLTAVKTGEISLSLPATDNYSAASMKIQVNIGTDVAKNGTNAYTIESDKVYSDGLAVNRENITMTFGNDGFWAKGTTFSAGQKNPTPDSGKIPTSGTYYKFTPAKNGTLTATVYIGKTADGKLRPLYVLENGTTIEAKAGDLTVGKGEKPAATEAYQGDVTFNVKANTDYYVYVNGSKMRLYGFTFVPVLSSDNTATFSRGVLNGETLTVTHHKSEANSDQTITVTPAIGATCTSVSGPATLDGDVIRYTAPVAGASLADITLTVTAENGDAKTYNIKVSTVGDVTIGNATFSLDELRGFGTRSDKGEVTVLTKENVTLTATENGVIEGGQTGTNGTKVKSGAGFTITPNNGVRITKITIVTDNTGRWFTATPTQEGEMKRTDKTYEYSFNSIDQAVTFMNNSGNNLYANRIIVEYEKSVEGGKTILSASFDKEELVFYMKDDIPSLPVLSVTAGGQSVASNLYDVKYTSSNTSVVTIDETGVLALPEGNIAGFAVINAEIRPKNSDTYVGSEAFYTVTVKPLDIPTVYAHDITVYNTAGMQPEPVVDVYVKDEAGRSISLPKDYYTLAYTQQSGDAILISDKTGKFILAGEAGNWTAGSAVVRVEFNPTDDARQQYHITDTYVDFNVHVVTAGARLIPEIGGVSEARMQISDNKSERSFVTPVLYDGVDISTGFTFKYTLRDANNTGSKFQNAASDGSVTSKGDGYVTLLSGMTAGTVYIDITATPDENYKSQYNEVTKAIRVTVADLKRYNSVTITPSSITAKVGDVLQGFDIVVRDEHDNIVSEDDYTMFWGSSAPGVVAIAGNRGAGVFNAVAAGKAIVRVFVTDKAGEYSDRKGECTVTVIDDGTFKVTPEKIAKLTGDKYDSSKENYGITASKLKGLELSVLDGLSVVLGGWMFPNSVKGSHGTTTETLGGAQWGAPTSKYRKPLGFTHNIHMGDQKNARQEYGSNCQPESNCIYDKTLTEVNDGFRLMDPMFNVPCSGSYLAFYPKTTGTVTVYIRQNGVFDNQTKNEVTTCVYRPQRRVFVIDEMGNFVSSTPKLEYPTTWNDNGLDTDGTKYTCDILGNSSEETKIYDLAKNDVTITGSTDKEKVQNWVKKHFEGLKTFDIAPDKFQNGVYASNLDNDITHNNAQLNHSGDRAAKGWCVLTAAPVSYKFNVKAGKTYYLYNYGSKLGLFGFTFRPTDFVVDEKTWSQTSETNSPEKTPDNHVAKVSIPDRTFPAGIWSACVLPFSMNRIQVNNVFGDCYDKNNLKGTQILYFDRVENGVIYFRRHAYNTIVAGKPFLIKPTKEAVISSENMGTKFPYVTIEAETPQAEWGRTGSNVDENYKWVSSYNKLAVVKGAHYINSDGGLSLYTRDDNAKMNGFRGYLKPKTAQAASKVLKLAYDSNIDGDGEATPIEGLVMDREGNLLEVPTSGVVYNLSGQVVTRDADKLYTLPAGIYIVNGKKYIVR